MQCSNLIASPEKEVSNAFNVWQQRGGYATSFPLKGNVALLCAKKDRVSTE